MNSKTKIQILLDNTPFPGAGQEIGGHPVIESAVDLAGKNWAIYLKGKLTASQVKAAISKLTTTYFPLPVQDEYSLVAFETKAMTHARTNPPGDVTVVRGHMYYARPNPISKGEFHKEMDDMLIDDPEKYFTKYTITNPGGLHERLWKGVSYAGEAYGWQKGNELWHRRASFIMPKIKINKALKGATMFYHTHPAKDEPSLTSADDIQFYLDLHFAWGIKSFYTVMKHKLDHFTITSKAGGKEKYLRMEEDAFIEVVDGMIGEGEKVAKEVRDGDDIKFQNRITKEMVDLFNKKFSSIAKISFRPKRKNPASKLAQQALSPLAALVNPRPNPPIKVSDEYVAKALEELKGLDYAHEHYGADEYGHTMYVYWWLKHHLAPTAKQPKGRLFKLNEYGMDSDLRKKLRAYLSQPIIGNYNYMDGVYLLALYHDIAKLREKGSKQPGWEIGADMFRKEIGPELNLPEKLTEDLAFLFDTDLGRKGITDELFATQAGDYYGISKLVHMADMVTHHPTMYTKKGGESYKQEAMVQLVNQLRKFLDHEYVIQNPPPHAVSVKWRADYGISDLRMEELEELLGDFHQSVVPDDEGNTKTGKESSGGHLYYLRFNKELVPALSRSYKATLALSSSVLLINVGKPVPDDLAKKDANIIYTLVGERLKDSYPELVIDEVTTPSIVNPRHASKVQVICISGPSGGGKSTVLRYLYKNLPGSSTPPTYTTRPKRPTDGEDRKFVTKTEFKKMIEQGKFVEYAVHGNGHFYGRVFDDFAGKYAIIEVSLEGKKAYEKRFPNIFTVYLDPDPSYTEQERAKAIFRRGGVSKEEAKRRAKKAAQGVARSKKMEFDLRVTMMKGKYAEGAKTILSEIPSTNPQTKFDVGITPEEQEEINRLIALDKERIAAEEAAYAEEVRLKEEGYVQTALPIEEEEEEEWDEEAAYRDLHDDAPWANPRLKPTVVLSKSSNKAKKFMAVFTYSDGNTKTTHFGAAGMSDYTIHKDQKRMKRYLARHRKNENWSDYTSAGSLSRWVLWNKPSLRGSWKDYLKRFGLKGVAKRNPGKPSCPLPPKKGIIIYGASYCGPCRMTKEYLDKKGKKYKYVDIETVKDYHKTIGPLTDNYNYIPVIFIDGKFLDGGYTSLIALKNPAVKVVKDEYRSRFIDEDGNDVTSIPVSSIEFKEGVNSVNFGEPITRDEARKIRRGQWLRVSVSAYKGKIPIIEVAPVRFWGANERINLRGFRTQDRKFFKNIKVEGPVYPTILSQIEDEPHAVLLVQGVLSHRVEFETRDDITDWKGESKGRRFEVYEEGEIFMLEEIVREFRWAPEGNTMRMDIHEWNKTEKTAENSGTITISDEGDHYFLHSIQVPPKWRNKGRLTDLIGLLLLNMPDRLPGHPKKPVRTLARVVEGIPQEKLVELLETRFGFRKLEEVDGGVLMQFDWPVDGRVIKDNPPRSRPFPWNKQLVQRSPLRSMKRAQRTLDSWKEGNAIGETASSSLKSMGKIPRGDGKYEVGYVANNPKAPGYNSYGWTTQDWRSIKVNSKGDIDYSEKCGAEGTRTKSGKPRLCLAAPIIRSLMKTESGKEVLRTQARKKLRAKKGERVPWHPRIKKLHKKLEERTPEDR
jgi:guanylate kinase